MLGFATPTRAVTRAVGSDFARCLQRSTAPLDPEVAQTQHAGYVRALRDAGVEVQVLDALPAYPDAPFVEDAAVIVGGHVLVTRPGAPARRGETAAVAEALTRVGPAVSMAAPATLDGGDVLRMRGGFLVGISARTNAAGAELLQDVADREGLVVHRVVVPDPVLHLKSVCSAVDPETLLCDVRALSADALAAVGVEVIEVPEPEGANVLALGDRVLCSASAPRTRALLEARGHRVVPVEIAQFERADAALSCLSLRVAAPGSVCV